MISPFFLFFSSLFLLLLKIAKAYFQGLIDRIEMSISLPSNLNRIQILPSLKLGEYLLQHQRIDGSFGNLEETYWAIKALCYLNKVDMVDKDALLKYVLDCKRVNGFAANPHESEINLHSFFYAINILFLIGKQKILSMDEYESIYRNIFNFQRKNGGFAHCNLDFCQKCKGKVSLKSTYFAIYCLKLLYEIDATTTKKIISYLSKQHYRNDIQQVFRLLSLLLLDHIELIDEDSITRLINLQESNGGFGSLESSFWVIFTLETLKRLRNVNKGKIFEYIRSFQKEDSSFMESSASDHSDLLYIKPTSLATISLVILWNELVEFIEQKVLLQIYTNERILIEEIAEETYVRFDLLLYLIKNLMRYDWFKVEIQDTIDIFKKYIEHFDAISRRIAVNIVKYIVNQNVVNLSELAKTFSANDYSKALERVIAVASTLIKEKFVIGEISWNKRFFKVTAFLNGTLPGKALIRLSQIPYHEVTVEKGQVPVENRRIQETIEQIKPITDKIRSEIDNLLDLNEVELAKTHLQHDISDALTILNSSNQSIETNLSKFQYLNGEYTHSLLRDWLSIYRTTKDSILQLEKEFLTKIKNKERVIGILNQLEKFQDYVQEQLDHITTDLNSIQKLFQQASEEKSLELKKQELKKNLDNISIAVEKITPDLRQQAANLFKATGELRFGQDSTQLSALQPLEKWLESMWMKKRKNTIKIIQDIKSHLNAREELKEIIKNRTDLFNTKINELREIVNKIIESNQFSTAAQKLTEKTEEILNYLSESNDYLLNFIQDTTSYLEGFQLTVNDIYEEWTKTLLENMRSELNSVKSDLEDKILTKKELDKNLQLEGIIEENIRELKKLADSMEKEFLQILEGPKFTDILKEIKRKEAEIDELKKQMTLQINEYIKKTLNEFQDFHKTSRVTVHRWSVHQDSFQRYLSLIEDRVKNKLILKLLFASAPMFRGGRIKFDYLASKTGLKKDEIEDRIIYLISIAKLEAQIDKENNEIIPLTDELKAVLEFEHMIQDNMDSLNKDYERTKRLFETSCRKRQLDDKVIEEIIGRTRSVLSRKYETELNIEEKIKNLPQHIDLNLLVEKWLQQKVDVEHNLAFIKQKISKRMEFKEKLLQYLRKMETEISELPGPIEIKIDFGEVRDASKLLSKSVAQIENELKKFDQELKTSVEKISTDLPRFDLVVADLLIQWTQEKTKLRTDLSFLNARLKERINDTLTAQYKTELEELIHNCNAITTNFLSNYEKDVDHLIQKGELLSALHNLQNYHNKFTKIEKNCESQITYFVNSKSRSLKGFKDSVNVLLSRWDMAKQDQHKIFQENYLQLENQLLIKYLQIQQTVFQTTRINLAQISKKLKIKKNELKQRFISLITAEKLAGNLDPNNDIYIFPGSRIEDAEFERPPSDLIPPETPTVPLQYPFWHKITELFRRWYYIIGSIGSVTSATAVVLSLTSNVLLALLIPSIVFPTLFIYAFYSYNKQKNKIN